MALKKKQLVAEGKLDKHGRPNEQTPPEYLRSLPAPNSAAQVSPCPCLPAHNNVRPCACGDPDLSHPVPLALSGAVKARAVRSSPGEAVRSAQRGALAPYSCSSLHCCILQGRAHPGRCAERAAHGL